MSSPLTRRLTALERASYVPRVVIRVFATMGEADADTEPVEPGTDVFRIVTGVVRASETAP